MNTKLISINVGRLQPLAGRGELTGHYKAPVSGPWPVGALGLKQDAIGDPRYHGGPDQAVYVYSLLDYNWWAEQLGRPLEPGTFGENLTVSDFPWTPKVGDRWNFGEVVLEVTGPRIPCSTLAGRMGDPKFVKKFAAANRGGFYARVLQSGQLEAGQEIQVQPFSQASVEVNEIFTLWHSRHKDPEVIRRALDSPLAERARAILSTW